MTKHDIERLERLLRRRDFLHERISSNVGDLTYDKAEASALTWAIEKIEGIESAAQDQAARVEKLEAALRAFMDEIAHQGGINGCVGVHFPLQLFEQANKALAKPEEG